jgi:hypothetical protein
MATVRDIEIGAHVSVGIVRPGDKLVIAVSGPLGMDERDDMRRSAERALPGVEAVVIQAETLLVYRP